MWTRKASSSLGNSGPLKYSEKFSSSEHPKYYSITLNYFSSDRDYLELAIHLKDKSLFKHTIETVLHDYTTTFLNEKSGLIWIKVDNDSCKKAYELLGLSDKCFIEALDDISQVVILANKLVSFDQPISAFFHSVKKLEKGIKAAIATRNDYEEKRETPGPG